MTTPGPTARFEELLSSRARIGWAARATARPVSKPLYEFGGGYGSRVVPLRRDGRGDGQDDEGRGADALTYGDAQGYRGLRELICHKYKFYENLAVTPENIFVANGSGAALSLAFSAFVDPGDPMIIEAPTFSGSLNNIRRHGLEVFGVLVDADGMVTSAVRESLEDPALGPALQADLHDRQLPEPGGADLSIGRRQELIELRRGIRHLHPGRRRLQRAPLRRRLEAAGLRARPHRPRHPRRDALEDSGRRRPARLAAPPRDAPGVPGLQLRRRCESVHVARGDLLPARAHGSAREGARRRLSRQARRHAARAVGSPSGHRRRDQPAARRLLHLDQAAVGHQRGPARRASAAARAVRRGVLRRQGRRAPHSWPSATSSRTSATRGAGSSRRPSSTRRAPSGAAGVSCDTGSGRPWSPC